MSVNVLSICLMSEQPDTSILIVCPAYYAFQF